MSWPRFAILYRDEIVEGGGPEEETVEVTLRLPKAWVEAPLDGVQAVIIEDEYSTRAVWRSSDYFYWIPGGEVCSTDDLGPFLRAYVPWVKHGLCLSQAEFAVVMQRAKEYRRIPMARPIKPRPESELERQPNEVLELKK